MIKQISRNIGKEIRRVRKKHKICKKIAKKIKYEDSQQNK